MSRLHARQQVLQGRLPSISMKNVRGTLSIGSDTRWCLAHPRRLFFRLVCARQPSVGNCELAQCGRRLKRSSTVPGVSVVDATEEKTTGHVSRDAKEKETTA